MKVEQAELPEVLLFTPDTFKDGRGYFLELWREERYIELGIRHRFVQDNLSYSERGTLRGLHLQTSAVQAKLVTVLDGEVYDVAVDVRVGSPTFGRWVGIGLSGSTKAQMYIPAGYAHGFQVLSETALFHYKASAPYRASSELAIAWNSPELDITWPIPVPRLSARDASAPSLTAVRDRLPVFQGP